MATRIPIPGAVYARFRPVFWQDRAAAIEANRPWTAPVEFYPVPEQTWKRVTEEGRQQALELSGLKKPVEGPETEVDAHEVWKPASHAEWMEMQTEIDRMYSIGELGRKATAFGAAGAIVKSAGVRPSRPKTEVPVPKGKRAARRRHARQVAAQ